MKEDLQIKQRNTGLERTVSPISVDGDLSDEALSTTERRRRKYYIDTNLEKTLDKLDMSLLE